MQALILAAGCGSRLNGSSKGRPKCLVEIGGKPIIEHQLDTLHEAGIDKICVVVGYRDGDVTSTVGKSCVYVKNPKYADTNSLYSLSLARRMIKGPFVLMNCDVFADPEIYRRVMSTEGSSLAFDSSSGDEDEHMKVAFENGMLRSIAKDLPAEETHGENVGILRFDEKAAELLFEEAVRLVETGSNKSWAPLAVGMIADRVPIRGLDVAGLPWAEIDFPDDLEYARKKVWPAIDRRSTGNTHEASPNIASAPRQSRAGC
jgi:choline kinase